MATTLYLNGRLRTIASVDALDWLLDALHRDCDPDHPTIESIEGLHGCRVDVGLGAPEAFVIIFPDQPPNSYYITSNPLPRLDGKRYEDFWLHGMGHTSVETCYLVPIATARRAVREFFLTGARIADVSWLEQYY